jgi:hypothetical protein
LTTATTWRKRQLSHRGLFMASTTKRGTKKSNAKSRRSTAKKSKPKQAPNIQSLQRALDESIARETATSDILRMIVRSPAALQPVLDAIAERAARLCDAADAVVWRVDGAVRRRHPVFRSPSFVPDK